ncbi:gamma-glutamyl-gamma-aminobutyrate hydrolase family protein [Aquisalimonas sp.]|uniref:gamma-glutamyl-gamma-aminobutyrate hydrolase family protein n=1 Tax=Aquisalimonas sp. TaxID=1872621 RepID=UPI0025C1931F|nr:gamma-glutamyl-gamma-aminobutyrate hydrolase family protein [Aquisalimonas sp.]
MRPIVGVTACYKAIAEVGNHCVANKYAEAVTRAADCVPVLIPALGDELDIDSLLARLDGVLATGSPSGVEPVHYGGESSRQTPEGLDQSRDATTLPLLRAAVQAGVPVLAICRGHQELNVALGGSLHQFVHELPGKRDHREDTSVPEEERYGPVHSVRLAPNGFLAELFGREQLEVNSLHWQGIDQLAPGLVAEAWAEDGLIEGARVVDAPAFAVSVQWHPEWRAAENPYTRALFQAFGKACRERGLARHRWSASA